jgi:Zn-dependent peptidase ImmA (M78 family)
MKNLLLSPTTTSEIDKLVERVIKGLGSPEPPLRLENVRELLNLDRQFYTAHDPSAVRESISRIRVATVQVFKRPMLLIEAIRKLNLKALYIPDSKRILLDGDLPPKKHRWNEAHEVGHSLLPWHEDLMHGDDDFTVSSDCHEQIEAEANYAAGRLLFFQDLFDEHARSMSPTLSSVLGLHKFFGNTLTTTLYRFVESVGVETPLVGLITCHPHPRFRPKEHDAKHPCRHIVLSPAFRARFSKISDRELFEAICGYCGPQSGGPLGEEDLLLSDDNGVEHRFHFETFYNRHDALTLGVYQYPEPCAVAVG